jgi:hypothetical protein
MQIAVKNDSLLHGVDSIADWCGISKEFFYILVKKYKLPATKIEGKWIAHKKNLDDYFQVVTRHPARDVEEE